MGLKITRHAGETITVTFPGEAILTIRIVRIGESQVDLDFIGPEAARVYRTEVFERIQREQQAARRRAGGT